VARRLRCRLATVRSGDGVGIDPGGRMMPSPRSRRKQE
jgi:hypothetical protein